MRLTIVVLVAAFAGLAASAVQAQVAKGPLKVCLLSGCNTYNSEESLPPFQEYLQRNFNVRSVRVVRKADDDLPGLEQLDDCDVAFVFIKRMKLKGDQLERFKKYATSGRPIVAVRTASHAVQTWLDFDHEVLGGNYHSHHSAGPIMSIEVAASAERHPILAGVQLKAVNDALYKNDGHSSDIHVLLQGNIHGQPAEAIAWTREYKGGRIFYTSLGAQDTFQQPDFRRMLANALFWTARREMQTKQP